MGEQFADNQVEDEFTPDPRVRLFLSDEAAWKSYLQRLMYEWWSYQTVKSPPEAPPDYLVAIKMRSIALSNVVELREK